MIGVDKGGYDMNFEETELCLGLPGGSEKDNGKNSAKRGFSETMDLLTGLQSKDKEIDRQKDQRQRQEEEQEHKNDQRGENRPEEKNLLGSSNNDDPPEPSAPKAQVVGWPPVRSFRRSISTIQKDGDQEKVSSSATFVKVSMDGAPYLRKVDLKMYKSYKELSHALGKMFSSFTIGNCESQGMKDFMNEKKLMDLLSGSEYQPTYEDKDGDWMLVGDVPWQMFVDSCKRIRIMKGADAIGLAPRAVEKCKNRS